MLPCSGRTWGCYLQTIKSNVFDDLGFQKLLGYPLAREGKRPVGRLCVYLTIWDFRNCLGTRWRGRASGPLAAFVCSVRSCWLAGWLASWLAGWRAGWVAGGFVSWLAWKRSKTTFAMYSLLTKSTFLMPDGLLVFAHVRSRQALRRQLLRWHAWNYVFLMEICTFARVL